MRPTKALIRLCACEALLVAHTSLMEISCCSSYMFAILFNWVQHVAAFVCHSAITGTLVQKFVSEHVIVNCEILC